MRCAKWTCFGVALGILVTSGPRAVGATAQSAPAATQPADPPGTGARYVGEVTGNNVYVRSKPDQNWYPTTKLKKGDRVEVYDEQFGWLKIRPPRGSFCYVDKSFVIRDRGDKGVVKGDNVYVRAGSELPEHARNRTCVATSLSKGAEIKIISEHPDGYYRIVPPKGAFYWISRQFVRRVGGPGTPIGERAGRPPTEDATTLAEGAEKKAEPAEESPGIRTAGLGAAPAASQPAKPPKLLHVWQKKCDLVDAELKAALRQKPPPEDQLRTLRKRFVPIAEQNQEDVPRAYAKIRIKQIDVLLERAVFRARINRITAKLPRAEPKVAATRAALPVRPDYEGKLVRSFAFEGRYRIVDRDDGKTLVYLEFPPECGIAPAPLVGRYVKVRAKAKRYDRDARRNIVVPAEVVAADAALGAPSTKPVGPPAPAASANEPVTVDAPE